MRRLGKCLACLGGRVPGSCLGLRLGCSPRLKEGASLPRCILLRGLWCITSPGLSPSLGALQFRFDAHRLRGSASALVAFASGARRLKGPVAPWALSIPATPSPAGLRRRWRRAPRWCSLAVARHRASKTNACYLQTRRFLILAPLPWRSPYRVSFGLPLGLGAHPTASALGCRTSRGQRPRNAPCAGSSPRAHERSDPRGGSRAMPEARAVPKVRC